MSKKLRTKILRLFALILVILLSLYIFKIRNQVQQLAVYGYPGIFLLSILANATVFLPAPGVAFVFAMGAIFNPYIVAIAASLGATIGELSGYLAGFSGQAVIENVKIYARMTAWMEKKGDLAILLLAFFPNPFFDLAGIAAGALKMPVQRFFFWCLIGKIFKMLVFALAGASAIKWFS